MKSEADDKSYFYTKANKGKSKDRYILAIRDDSLSYGYRRIVFHSSRNEAAIKAKAIYEEYIESLKKHNEPEQIDETPETVIEACTIFMKRRATGRKETCQSHSIDQVTARYKNHLIPFFRSQELSTLKVEDMTRYKEHLQSKGLADKTVHYCIDEAKELFSYCVEVGWMERSPFDSTFKMARPKPKKKRIPGDIDDYRLVLTRNWKNPVNHGVALICFFTGMRVSEIRALKKNDFEPWYGHDGTEDCVVIRIRHNLTNKNVEKSPKNERERLTVIPRWVYEFVSPVFNLSRTSLCFSNTAGRTPISIDKNLKNFRKELSLVTGLTVEELEEKGIVFHSLRAMFNSMMTGNLSSDIRRGILGWTSENVALEHYFKVLPVHYQMILDAQKVLFDQESIDWFRMHDIFGQQKENTKEENV